MTAKEAIEIFTEDDDYERNHRNIPLLAKAFDDVRNAYDIPRPFHKWLIALGCPDEGRQLVDAALVTSSLFAGLMEKARTAWVDEPETLRALMLDLISFAEPIAEQVWLMRQAIAAIDEVLEQPAPTEPTTAAKSATSHKS
jgi:hypothetical protein